MSLNKCIYVLLLIVISATNLYSQQKFTSDICNNMGYVIEYIRPGFTQDSLDAQKERCNKKGIEITYSNIEFNESGTLTNLDLKVICKGCGSGGTNHFGKRYFRLKDSDGGFFFNHGYSPYFSIGSSLSKD